MNNRYGLHPACYQPRPRIRSKIVVQHAQPTIRHEVPYWIGPALVITGFGCLALMFLLG
jgi:hypothetical protein